MKRGVLLAALALLLAPAGCGAPRTAGPDAARPAGGSVTVRMVVLGDSLAFGTGASGPANGFAFLLYQRLLAKIPRSEVRNFAIGGTTVADVRRLEAGRLRGLEVDVVLVVVGGNDVVQRTPPERFEREYTALVKDVRSYAPHAHIVLFGVPDVAISPIFPPAAASAIESLSRADDSAVRRIACLHATEYVDLFGVTRQARGRVDRFLAEDRFHPSDEGHAAIAAAAWPAIARALWSQPQRSGRC